MGRQREAESKCWCRVPGPTWCWLDSARFARSVSRRSFCMARLSLLMSICSQQQSLSAHCGRLRSIRPAAAGAVPYYRECRCPKHGMGPWRRRDTFLGCASFGSHHAEVKPTLYLRLTSFMKYSITRWSKSSPPRWVSPDVDTTCACGKAASCLEDTVDPTAFTSVRRVRLFGRPAQSLDCLQLCRCDSRQRL